MANIREQCSWVHDDRAPATDKAKALTRAAVLRVAQHEPLERRSVDMCPNTLVIGGGIAGMSAALDLADAGGKVYLVERDDHLGGNVARVDLTAPYLDSARDMLTDAHHARRRARPNIEVLLEFRGRVASRASSATSSADIRGKADGGGLVEQTVDVGSVIVATGYKEFDAGRITHYGYGKLPNVITSFELEKMLREGGSRPRRARRRSTWPSSTASGSRNHEFHTYCSRVCCMTALKYAHEIKAAVPDCYVERHLHRHARLRQGPRGLLPAQLRGQDALPHVREERLPGRSARPTPRTTARC